MLGENIQKKKAVKVNNALTAFIFLTLATCYFVRLQSVLGW